MTGYHISAGLAGKILRVDLASGSIWTEPTAPYAERWIGGRAINSYLLLTEAPSGTRWSDPHNPLIFGSGALVGTVTVIVVQLRRLASGLCPDGQHRPVVVAWRSGQHPPSNKMESGPHTGLVGATGVTGVTAPGVRGTQAWRLASGVCPAGQHWPPATWLLRQHWPSFTAV
jgi:hypothetical protein